MADMGNQRVDGTLRGMKIPVMYQALQFVATLWLGTAAGKAVQYIKLPAGQVDRS